MPISTTLIRKITEVEPPLREILILILEEMERQRAQWEESVTKTEFNELKEIVRDLGQTVKELAEAQRRTEERVDKLSQRMEELVEAQKRTEACVEELAEAQKRTEQRLEAFEKQTEENFNRVWKAINELAEAQKRTEERLEAFEKQTEENFNRVWKAINELAEAQKRTEARVEELAEAQKRTEKEVAKLARGLSRLRKEVGGLSRSMAYALENEAYRHLPSFLKRHLGLELIDHLVRTYVDGEEINIFGRARRNGQEVYLIGEAVLKLDDPAKLKQLWKKIQVVKEQFGGEVVPILVTHFARPDVLEKARKAGIVVVQSFEWMRE